MNRISKRAWFALALAIILALGVIVFTVRYCIEAGRWATFQGSPHVYSGGNLNTGVVTDRSGTVLLDATDGLVNRAGPRGAVPRPEWRPQTHFETRGQNLGHGVWDLLYDRS